MAAVTVNSTPYTPQYNVAGSKRQQFYNISGNNGDTLTVGLLSVLQVTTDQPALVTSVTLTSLANNQTQIAFNTTGGAFTALNVQVLGN